MSPPWMPLYIAELREETQHLSTEQFGAYMLLLFDYWVRGEIPNEDERQARVARMSIARWKKDKAQILAFFSPDLRHPRADSEKAKKRVGRGFGIMPAEISNPLPSNWRELREFVFARDNYICAYCGIRGGSLECDHVHPRSKNGSHDPSNLVTACQDCNRSKRSLLLEEWATAK